MCLLLSDCRMTTVIKKVSGTNKDLLYDGCRSVKVPQNYPAVENIQNLIGTSL